MGTDTDRQAQDTLGEVLLPLARLMIAQSISLPDAVELLKTALVRAATDMEPDAPASRVSLMTGVHRKDVRRLEAQTQPSLRGNAAARVLSTWQNDPDFAGEDGPKPLSREGGAGFDALVRRAKVDAAPATVLSLLLASGNVTQTEGEIAFRSGSMVPSDHGEKLRAAVATLTPHLETAVSNLAGNAPQWDRALRYSDLTEAAARELEADAAALSLELLQTLDRKAHRLQQEAEGPVLFVAGTFTHISEPKKT